MSNFQFLNRAVVNRYSISTCAAVVITGGLLLVMQYAIQSDETKIDEPPIGDLLTMVRVIEEPEVLQNPRRVVKPPVVDQMPPPIQRMMDFDATGETGLVEITDPDVTVTPTTEGFQSEGEMLPIMTVPPEYPQREQARGTQGWVIVEFTVDQLGRVQTPQVIDAEPSRVFDRAAIKAVKRYKYKPRVLNGEAVPVTGVRQRIVFQLS